MFTVYARNINAFPGEQNPPLPNQEIKLFSIPAEEGDERPFLSASVSNELSNAGSFEFTVDPESRFADIWRHMRTLVRVEYDGETIFFGRVLTIDRDMFRSRKIHCEGAYTFLMDSAFEGKTNGYNVMLSEYIQILVDAHNKCMVDCPDKQIQLGEVPGHYSVGVDETQKMKDEKKRFGSMHGYKAVKEWLEELVSNYGGFMRVRYESETYNDTIGQYGRGNIDLNNRIVIHNDDGSISTERSFSTEIDGKEILLPQIVNGQVLSQEDAIAHYIQTGEMLGQFDTDDEADQYAEALHERQEWYYTGQHKVTRLYLDWLKTYFNKDVNDQHMTVSSNAIDLSDTIEIDNIFTHVIAIGEGWHYSDGTKGSTNGKHKITIVKESGSADPGCKAGASPSEADKGETVRLTAKPMPGWYFTGWTVSSGGVTLDSNTFVMGDSDVTITAHFSTDGISLEDPHTINILYSSSGGSAWANRTTAKKFQYVTLNASPNSGHTFRRWAVNRGGVSIANPTSKNTGFYMSDSDVVITANFDIDYVN